MSSTIDRDKKYVWHPFTQMQTAPDPICVVQAKDAVLYAEDGKTYIDCNSSWWLNVHGHGNEHLGNALRQQFEQIDHVIFAGVTHPKAVELAERLVHKLPDGLDRVFFSDNGSTAVEVALKTAFQYWFNLDKPRKRILALEGAYHGDTFGAMAIGQRGYFNKPFEHFFFDVDFIDFPTEDTIQAILIETETKFRTGEFAALIVEPLVQGSAGMRMYSAFLLEQLVDLARKYEVLVIFDEVMTAWGRTGKLFAFEHTRIVPDIICLSKGLTGGVMPLGLTVVSDTIYKAFLSEDKGKALLHGHSYTGNPLACALACASLDLFEQTKTWDNVQRIHAQHLKFAEVLEEKRKIRDVRLLGTILAFEIETGEGNNYFSSIRDIAYDFFLERGFLIRPLGNVIFLNPPYCITELELESAYRTIVEFLDQLR